MSTKNVARLDSYRSRRALRLAQAKALYSGDPARAPLVKFISAALSTGGGDRGAVVWLDEYGPSTAHVYCLVDVGSAEPRRDFEIDRLREAWDKGVPGLSDLPDVAGESFGKSQRRSLLTVALGSDGTRAWFLAVDSATPRARLEEAQADEFMFLAGQVGSIVLHRDQSQTSSPRTPSDTRFGWAVLRDMDGQDRDSDLSRRIATRFLVARLVRSVVESDFSIPRDSLSAQLRSVEQEFRVLPPDDLERDGWQRVLEGLRQGDRSESVSAVLELADQVVTQGHLEGALDLFHSAYLLGVGSGLSGAAIDGARFQGMVSRRLGNWDVVFHWYDVARRLAVAFGDDRRLGLALDGEGVSLRIQGDFEAATDCHKEVIAIAERIKDVTLEGFGCHSLMADLRGLRQYDAAIQAGWRAFQCHSSPKHRYRVLTSLAGAFVEVGDYDSAEHAYHLVLAGSKEFMHRIHSLDAVAYIKALRGDVDGFRSALERVDAIEWRASDVQTVASLIYYRGRGLALLGFKDEAIEWLSEAVTYCEEQGVNGIGKDTAQTLAELHEGILMPEASAVAGRAMAAGAKLAAIRSELVELRRRLTVSTA